MKKTLLFFLFFIAIHSQAQDYWEEFSTAQPVTSTGIRSISIVNTTTTWLNMSCGTVWNCVPIRRYAKTTNGGSVWTTGEIDLGPNSALFEINNIHGVSADVAYASVFPKSSDITGGIWKTVDGGTSWSKLDGPTYSDSGSFPTAVYFWNANEGVAVGDATSGYFEIYRTADAGVTWSRIPSAPGLIPIDPEEYIWREAQFKTTGNSIWFYTTFGRMLRSTDKGLTWTAVYSPIIDFCRCITASPPPNFAFTDENNGIISDDGYFLFSTNDGGATWQELPWTGKLRNFGIAAVPGMANTYISLGEDLDSTVRGSSYSIDGGHTWVDINDNPDTNYVQGGVINMLNEDYGFASGFTDSPTEGGIFRWGGGPMLRLAQLSAKTFENDQIVSVYPNPTEGNLNIRARGIEKIEIYDMTGKQISSEVYNLSYKISFDIGALKAGMYLLKVSHSAGQSIVKVVKE